MRFFTATASLLALSSSVSAESSSTEIDTQPQLAEPGTAEVIGGTAVPPGKWPDAVAVMGAQGSCTGTLIAPDVVLTAGHCVDAQIQSIIANTTDYQAAGGQRVAVKSVTAYPNWETSYDVAVVVLQQAVTGVTPRKVGTSFTFESFANQTMVHLVGFGSTDVQGQGANSRLNEVMAPVTDATCSGGNGCVPSISPGGEFVAGGGNRDSCFGDSGGPVYLDTPRGPVVVGAVSRGLENAATPCGGGGIYVRTDKIIQWIEQTAGKPVSKDLPGTGGGEEGGGEEGSGAGSGSGGGGGEEGGPGGVGEGDDLGGGDLTGGCSTSTSGGGLVLALGLLALRRRRRA